MLYVLPETAGDIIVLQATGTLTETDYSETLSPLLEEKVAAHGAVRCLIYLDPGFTGMEARAIWEDTKLGLKHGRDFLRLAIVGDSAWLDWAAQLGQVFIEGQAQHFQGNQFLQALHWIDEA